MRTALLRIAPILHLTRVSSAVAAVGNVWFVILWTRASNGREPDPGGITTMPLWQALGFSAVSAAGLYAYGAALNDALDAKRDRTLHPARPLASGGLASADAVGVIIVMLLAAVFGATAFGMSAVTLTLALSGIILCLNAAGKYVPAVGLVLLSLLYAGHMMVPNTRLTFVWPVWLVMTHTLLVAAVTHVVGRRVPRLTARAVVAAAIGWAACSALLFGLGWERSGRPTWFWPDWVSPAAAAYPLALVPPFIGIAVWKIRQHGPGIRAADKVRRYGSIWLPLYGAAWLLGAGHEAGAVVLGGLAAVTFLGMTFLREVYGLVESPVTFRR
ncbi:MAG: hypothetical protein IT437_08500 [Phycisphaerales bacterium]|nr:hypothetical protein [Phycisphaerales bacterium]